MVEVTIIGIRTPESLQVEVRKFPALLAEGRTSSTRGGGYRRGEERVNQINISAADCRRFFYYSQ
jgi:hypothetical protein